MGRKRALLFLGYVCFLTFVASLAAQDLGPEFKKIKDGIYVRSASSADPRPDAEVLNSNCAIILTRDGVVLIDSGQNPTDSQEILKAIKKLTSQPVRFLLDTEIHGDHTTGHFVFSPPAMVVAPEGGAEAMRRDYDPERLERLMAQSPEMREASRGYRIVTPQIEYHGKLTLHVGERTFELLQLENVHSEADTAIWLPQERVLFSGPIALSNAYNRIRPFVSIPDILDATRQLKSLNPEIVVPGHGSPGTTKIFDDSEQFYRLLLDRVGGMVSEGKTLNQIKQGLRMSEYDHLLHKERIPENIEGAYRAVQAGYKVSR